MRALSLILTGAVLCAAGFAPAPFPKKERQGARDDLQAMQGMWKMTEQAYSGNPTTARGKARVKGTVWTFVNPNGVNGGDRDGPSYTLTLETKVSPPALEWKSGSSVWVASYRLEGHKLTIIYTSGSLKEMHKRPTDFNGRVGHKMVFERLER